MAKKYALLIDLRRCVGCTSCQVSCKMENGVPVGSFRSRVDFADVGDYPAARRYFFPKMCNHCDNPPCIQDCPVSGATYKREDGVVMVNRELCIGCGRCVNDCPYGARYMHVHLPVKNDPARFAKKVPEVRGKKASQLRVVDKCDFCSHRLAEGIEEPACVRNCAGKARFFGDLNDPNSSVSKLMKSERLLPWRPEFETKPTVLMVAPDPAVFVAADGEINR